MSFIDWGAGAQSGQAALDQQQYAQNQLARSQQLRGLSALQGLNLNDPESLNGSVNALARLGLIDQASALSGLYKTSAINQSVVPLVQKEAADESQQGQSSQPQANQLDAAKHQRLLTEADQALSTLQSIQDPNERAQKAQEISAYFKQEENGVPDAAVDAALSDLSDAALQGHQAAIRSDLQQYAVQSAPGYQGAADALNRFAGKPLLTGALEGNGIPVSGGLNLAANLTAPGRGAQVQAAYAPQIAANTAAATNVATANTAGATHTTAAAQSGGAATGAAPFGVQEITLADGSKIQAHAVPGPNGTVTWQQIQPTPAASGAPAGGAAAPANPGFGATPSPQAQSVMNAGGEQLAADRAANSASMNQGVALHKILDLLPTTNTGPGTQVTNQWRSFLLSQFPILERFNPNLKEDQLQTAGANELRKYMVQVASAQAAQFGQGTNEKLAVAASGNPNTEMDALSARDVTRTTLAILRAQQAKTILWDQQHPNPADAGGYGAFASNYATQVDPRAFMLDMMSAPERQKMLAGITSPNDRKRFARGVIDAEQAGFINRADLPK